ncbi:MAG: hypothetical protein HC854_07910 [Flavobacterium sp.]|nr:hypothetical protein [Flavobacterium sp.]
MKKIILLPFFILLLYCKSAKNKVDRENKMEEEIEITTKNNSCPQDGTCTIEILKNKSLAIKKDEFNQIYFQEIVNNKTSIIKFQYQRDNEKGYADGNYREEIIFEINNTETSLNLSDNALQTTKMLFGRHCFCKGQAGYFNITKGNLSLTKENEEYKLTLDFLITEVPQIIKTISTSVK